MTTKTTPAKTGEVLTGQTRGNMGSAYTYPYTTKTHIAQVPSVATPLYVPGDLERVPQWVCWRRALVNGRLTKVPVNPRTGGNAATDKSATWADLDTALGYYHAHTNTVSGIGIVLRGTGLAGVDLDHCIVDGTIAPWAMRIVRAFASYTEVSPSGEGLRIFALGAKPGTGSKRGDIELYDGTSTRFLTFTGRHLPGTPLELCDASAAMASLYRELWPAEEAPKPSRQPSPATLGIDDTELLSRALTARNGARFAALWRGDTSGYPSASEADFALVGSLLFWAGGDVDRVDRLFRQSGLYREKWDERHAADGRTYGAVTIAKCAAGATRYYTPSPSPAPSVPGQAGAVVPEPPSPADLWRILHAHVTHDGERCPMCGRLWTEEWEEGDRTHGRFRLFRCKRSDCQDWQTHRAKQLVVQADMHLWPAHYATKLPVDDYDQLLDRGLLAHEKLWRGVLEAGGVVFVASAFVIDARSIATRLDALAPMLANAWRERTAKSRLRAPKKRVAVACDKPTVTAVTVPAPEPEPEPRVKPSRRYAFGLIDLDYGQGHDLLGVLEAAGAAVDWKRGSWSYRTADRANIASIVGTWSEIAGVGGRYEVDTFGTDDRDTNASTSQPGAAQSPALAPNEVLWLGAHAARAVKDRTLGR